MNPPQPSDFGIPQQILDDLKRLDGVWIKSFDHAWSRCKPYYEAWKKYSKSLEKFRMFTIFERTQFWNSMSPRNFESYSAWLLEKLGYSVRLSGGSNDHGVDIYASDNSRLTVVQCKAYNKLVGPDVVRALAGSMSVFKASRGWLFTLKGGSSGTAQAIREFSLSGLEIQMFHATDYAEAAMVAFYRENPNLNMPKECYSRIPLARPKP
jgi:hypothetical protein